MASNTNGQEVYNLIMLRLDELEAAEKAKIKPKEENPNYVGEMAYIETKYEIMRITSKHSLLMSLLSLYEGFNEAFLTSSDNRKKFFTNTVTKVNVDSTSADYTKVIEKGDAGFDKAQYPEWVEWQGCGMNMPESAYVVVSTNANWPTVYIKSKNTKEEDDDHVEINIYEHAWNANVYASDPDKIKRLPNYEIEPSFDEDNNDPLKFRHIRYEVQEQLADFDIVIEVPFFSPYLDVLTQVHFKTSENPADILLTACVCI